MAIPKVESLEQYNEVLKLEQDVVIIYSAKFCGGCRMLNPKLVKLTKELKNVVFVKVDVVELQELALDKGVTNLPYFTVHHNGKQIADYTGSKWTKVDEFIRSKTSAAIVA